METSQPEVITVKAVVDEHNEKVRKRRRKHRIVIWSLLAIVGLAVVLPMVSYTGHWLGSEAVAQEDAAAAAAGSVNPRSNYWRAVKEGVQGYSAVKGQETGSLVQPNATNWQQTRGGDLSKKLPWAIVIVAAVLLLFHLHGGRAKLDVPRSGRKIKRWSWFSRLVHWVTAISFIALSITGISMLIGKSLFIPIFGKAGFAAWAQLSIQIHNVLGPLFSVGIVLMIVMWIWHNIPTWVDVKWLAKAGGMFNADSHPSAGRMNAGEKLWFWLLATVGVVVCLTGLAMVAPIYGIAIPSWLEFMPWVTGTRADMQQASILHAALAIGWTAIALGHIYIGTAGTEGAFEGMATGYVSEEWAIQHHDLWAKKMMDNGKVVQDPYTTTTYETPAPAQAPTPAQSALRTGQRMTSTRPSPG